MSNAISDMYEISPSRLHCKLISMAKRVINDGEAEILIDQAAPVSGNGASDSFPIWAIIIAVIGGLLLLVAIIALIFFIVKKKSSEREAWEKY